MRALPVGEGDVVGEERGLLPAGGQPRGDADELRGRSRGENLADRHQVAGEV